MNISKTEYSKIKRSPIIGLLFMLCFIVASKVGASTLHKLEAYRIVRHEAQRRAIGGNYTQNVRLTATKTQDQKALTTIE